MEAGRARVSLEGPLFRERREKRLYWSCRRLRSRAPVNDAPEPSRRPACLGLGARNVVCLGRVGHDLLLSDRLRGRLRQRIDRAGLDRGGRRKLRAFRLGPLCLVGIPRQVCRDRPVHGDAGAFDRICRQGLESTGLGDRGGPQACRVGRGRVQRHHQADGIAQQSAHQNDGNDNVGGYAPGSCRRRAFEAVWVVHHFRHPCARQGGAYPTPSCAHTVGKRARTPQVKLVRGRNRSGEWSSTAVFAACESRMPQPSVDCDPSNHAAGRG
jgi:hypothetical protein